MMLHNDVLNTYVLPHLPPQLYRLAYPKPNVPQGPPSLLGSDASSSGASLTLGLGSSSSGSSGHSTVSGLTIPTTTGGGGGESNNCQCGTYSTNVTPDTRLVQLVLTGVKIWDLMGNDPLLTLDNGQQICLSFHLCNGCWSTCCHVASHGHALTDKECTRLMTYLQAQCQKLQAATGATAGHTQN